MARIEILQRGKRFTAQFRKDNGQIDAIAGSWESARQAARDLQAWKQQVNRASIKQIMPKAKPEPVADAHRAHAEDDGVPCCRSGNRIYQQSVYCRRTDGSP